MNIVLRKVLAVILGWLIGSVINMSLVQLGHFVFPIEGLDANDMDALSKVMPTLSNEYFIFPFLAHAIGTYAGALVAALIVLNHKMRFALIIGSLFLIGGIIVNTLIPAPLWFKITDLVLAYIPMAFLAGFLAKKLKRN
jgi:hypothetical protein